MYEKTILNNGLRLITYAMPRMQSAAVGFYVRAGARDESGNIKGIAHFLEHLVFKGSSKYSCQQIKELIEGRGGLLNAFTSEESTCYYAKLPAAKQFQALDILSDMAINPCLKPADIERERYVIMQEIKMYRDLPQAYVHELLDQLLWPGQPLGSPIIGNKKTILQLKSRDLSSFQKKYYTPSNIVIAACGRLEHGELLKKVKASLGGLKIYSKNMFSPALDVYGEKEKLKILRKRTHQIHLALGCYAMKRDHPDRYILSLLHIILGANMSSRLFYELREKRGLAYQIGTQVKGLSDTGLFMVHAGVDSIKMYEAVKLIIKELTKIKERLVSISELRRAKEFYIGQIRLALEDTLDHMFWIGDPTLHLDRTYSFNSLLKEVSRIKPDDLRRVARNIFKPRAMRLAAIGALKEEEEKFNACIRNL